MGERVKHTFQLCSYYKGAPMQLRMQRKCITALIVLLLNATEFRLVFSLCTKSGGIPSDS